jgi:hypothetical protein
MHSLECISKIEDPNTGLMVAFGEFEVKNDFLKKIKLN